MFKVSLWLYAEFQASLSYIGSLVSGTKAPTEWRVEKSEVARLVLPDPGSNFTAHGYLRKIATGRGTLTNTWNPEPTVAGSLLKVELSRQRGPSVPAPREGGHWRVTDISQRETLWADRMAQRVKVLPSLTK